MNASTRRWVAVTAFVSAYALAVLLGRATRIEGTQFSLVWPAAAVAFLWLASSWRRPAERPVSILVLFALTVVSHRLTGVASELSLALGAANVVNACAAVYVFRRFRPQGWQLDAPADLTALVAAAVVGAILSAGIGPLALWATAGGELAAMAGTWVLRNAVSVALIAAVGLRWSQRRRPGAGEPIRGDATIVEALGVVALSGAVHLLVFASGQSLPVVFLTVPFAVWAGTRLATTHASVYVVASGSLIIGRTLGGSGPFGLVDPMGRAVLAQALVAVVGILTLMLALHRDQRERLIRALHDANRDAAEQAEAATASRDRFSSVLSAATEQSIIATDTRGRVTVFNAGAERMLGWPADEVIGRSALLIHDREEVARRAQELGIPVGPGVLGHGVTPARATTRQWSYIARSGDRRQVTLTVTAMHEHGDRSEVTGYIGVATDITQSLAAEEALRDSEQRFRRVFETASVAMAILELSDVGPGRLLQVNPAFSAFTGYDEHDLVGRDLGLVSHPGDLGETKAPPPWLEDGATSRPARETRFRRRDGETVWGMTSGAVVGTDTGSPTLILLIQDVTARKAAEAALTHQAFHDPLTGLANRALLDDRLAHALVASGRLDHRVGLIYADLDGFKAVNDRAGHAAGDEVLNEVARRLVATVRAGDTVARIGGDEFAVVCPGVDDERLSSLVRRIQQVMSAPLQLDRGTFTVGISVGTRVGDAGTTVDDMLRDADREMYAVKRARGAAAVGAGVG